MRKSGLTDVPDILKKIIERKFQEVTERSASSPIALLHEQISEREPVRGFVAALATQVDTGRPAVIAESKRASPSKGVLRADYSPAEIAQSYQQGGAACLSVLTDKDFFQGSEAHLKVAKSSCSLPVIRKDFIVDSYQVLESAAIGADCILLIVAALDDATLLNLHQQALALGLDVLVEVHDRSELDRALSLGIALVGINNRNLRTFDVSLDTTISLLAEIPDDVLVVTESGIVSRSDVEFMQSNGVNVFLVGEAFMRTTDPGATLKSLFMCDESAG